jgi:hypothetical protein
LSRPVYSTNFIAETYPVTTQTFVVPSGDVCVLKEMTLWVRDTGVAGSPLSLVVVELDAPGINVWDVKLSNLFAGVYQWVGREVFSGYLTMNVAAGYGYSFRANGYVLTAA